MERNAMISSIMRGLRDEGFTCGGMENQTPVGLKARIFNPGFPRFAVEVFLRGQEEGSDEGGAMSYMIDDKQNPNDNSRWEMDLLSLMMESSFDFIEMRMDGPERMEAIMHYGDSGTEELSISLVD